MTVQDRLVESTPFTTQLLGTGMIEHAERVDFAALRDQRRARVFDEMARLDLDALILSREGNVRYASGARRLWMGNTRPFAPTCILVRATQRVHLMTFGATFEGVPEEYGEDVFCTTFNPAVLASRVGSVPALAEARRVGVDGLTLDMRGLLAGAAPHATFVGVEPELRELRRTKLPGELAAMRIAIALGESAVAAAVDRLAPGVSEKDLQAAFLDRMCQLGTSQFAQQGTFTVIGPNGGLRWITGTGRIPARALVALAAGALWAGYEGSVARTWMCGAPSEPTAEHRELYERWQRTMDAMIAACRPGATGEDLVRAHVDAGEPVPSVPIAYSVGLGHEGLVAGISPDRSADAEQLIGAGMIVALRTFVSAPSGGFLGEEIVHVGPDRTERLTSLGHGPLSA